MLTLVCVTDVPNLLKVVDLTSASAVNRQIGIGVALRKPDNRERTLNKLLGRRKVSCY